MRRYAIYSRVSTEEQSRPGHVSLEAQVAACRHHVVEDGGIVVREDQDVQSGLDPTRPGYLRLKDAAKRREIDTVIVFRFDRWGRDPGEALTSFRDLQALDVNVTSVMEPSDDPFLRGLFALLGFRESQATSQRTIAGLRRRATKGEWSGAPPLGYQVHRDNGRSTLIVDPLVAPFVVRLFEDAATGRYSLAQLADRAKVAGLRGRTGHIVSRQAVGRMLRNPSFAGSLVYGRTSNSKLLQRGKRPRDEWINVPDAHPPLIDQDTFDRVQAVLTRHRREQGTVRGTRLLLTSLAYCGRCASTPGPNGMARTWRVYGHGTKGAYYECSRRSMYGECDLPSISAPGLDKAIKGRIAEAFQITPELRERAANFIAAEVEDHRAAVDNQRRELERSLDRHKRNRVELARRYVGMAAQAIPEDVYRQLESEEADAVVMIERTLAGLPVEPPPTNVASILDALESLTWNDLSQEGWRQVAVLLIERVVIHGRGDFEVEWQPPAEAIRSALAKVSGFGSRRFGYNTKGMKP